MVSELNGVFLIATAIFIFAGLSYALSFAYKIENSKLGFLLANRKLNFFESSFSVAATWIWAPALFVSTQQAYVHGWIGLMWFTVPNVLCLLLFAYFAVRIKNRFPEGFTLSEYMKSKYSKRVQNVYWTTLLGLTVCAFAVQLLAGGQFINKITGLPFWISTVILALIPLAYSFVFGLKSSIITDFVKMILILTVGAVLVPSVIYALGDFSTVVTGFGGISGKYLDFFTPESWTLFLTFGLPVTIGLLSGPFGDQSFWQRTFATKTENVGKSFITAAFIFALVPLMMGLIGLSAAGAQLTITNKALANVEIIFAALGIVGVIAFFFMTLAALTSILDSKMCSVSSIAGHDFATRWTLNSINSARTSIIVLTILALIIANIPGLQILHLFLFYGTLRASTLVPTVLTLLDKRLNESAVFYGILSAIFIGLPIFAYGNLNKIPEMIVGGSLATVLFPLVFILLKK
jgi:urea-proton symporter